MVRWFAPLGMLLLAGCGSSSSTDSARLSAPRQQPASSQTALAPQPTSAALTLQEPDHQAAPETVATGQPTKLQQAAAPADAAPPSPPRPPAYKQSIAAYIKRYAVDPDSLQQGKIGTPASGSLHGESGSIVCVELAGQSSGGGSGRTAYLLRNNTVIDSEYGAPVCNGQHLDPW